MATQQIIASRNTRGKRRTLALVEELGYDFLEMETRMNYGLIGRLTISTSAGISHIFVYTETFYVHNGEYTAINKKVVKMIQMIQKHFKDL